MARSSPDQLQMSFGTAEPQQATAPAAKATKDSKTDSNSPPHPPDAANPTKDGPDTAQPSPSPETATTEADTVPPPEKPGADPAPDVTATTEAPAQSQSLEHRQPDPETQESGEPAEPAEPANGSTTGTQPPPPSPPATAPRKQPAAPRRQPTQLTDPPARTQRRQTPQKPDPQAAAARTNNRTSNRADGEAAALKLTQDAQLAQDTQVILDLATTTTPGGWVSQSYTEGLTSTLMANGLIGRVTIKPHTRQARTVLDYMRGLLGADLQLEPPTDPL